MELHASDANEAKSLQEVLANIDGLLRVGSVSVVTSAALAEKPSTLHAVATPACTGMMLSIQDIQC